ncbi:hypothetical protein CRUP_014522 [Coryphaenoides rupestris]|nr:hypothetical protein CRUP_014522 [Coryphaenoides rupestris]
MLGGGVGMGLGPMPGGGGAAGGMGGVGVGGVGGVGVGVVGGVGVGANGVAGGVNGGGPIPRLHSAIVERLRARIELCRRHHATCESRYRRGEAERSDRGHESTLHLLNIVHQQGAAGTRKAKGGRAAANQPAASSGEYGRSNGEQKAHNSATDGDNKISARIAWRRGGGGGGGDTGQGS